MKWINFSKQKPKDRQHCLVLFMIHYPHGNGWDRDPDSDKSCNFEIQEDIYYKKDKLPFRKLKNIAVFWMPYKPPKFSWNDEVKFINEVEAYKQKFKEKQNEK